MSNSDLSFLSSVNNVALQCNLVSGLSFLSGTHGFSDNLGTLTTENFTISGGGSVTVSFTASITTSSENFDPICLSLISADGICNLPITSCIDIGCVLPTPPTLVTATETTILAGGTTTLSYTGGTGDTFEWFSGSCGETPVLEIVSPAVTTTYFGRWKNSCGVSVCQSVEIQVLSNPVFRIDPPTAVCPDTYINYILESSDVGVPYTLVYDLGGDNEERFEENIGQGTFTTWNKLNTAGDYQVYANYISSENPGLQIDQTRTVSVLPAAQANKEVIGDEVCAGEAFTVTVLNAEQTVIYTLRGNNTP